MTTTESSDVTMARLGERIENLIRSVAAVQDTLTNQATTFVPRTEWLLRNEAVNREFQSKGAEIAELRTEVRSRRLPWTQVVSTVAALAAVAITLIPLLAA